jgi:hypothetical protein
MILYVDKENMTRGINDKKHVIYDNFYGKNGTPYHTVDSSLNCLDRKEG